MTPVTPAGNKKLVPLTAVIAVPNVIALALIAVAEIV